MSSVLMGVGLGMHFIMFTIDCVVSCLDFELFFSSQCMFRQRHFGMHACYMGVSYAVLFHIKSVVAARLGSPGTLAGVELLLLFSNLGLIYSKESHALSVWLILICSAVQLTAVSPLVAMEFLISILVLVVVMHFTSAGKPQSTVRSVVLYMFGACYLLFHLAYLFPGVPRAPSVGREILETWVSGAVVTIQALSVLYFDVYLAKRADVGTNQGSGDGGAGVSGPNGSPSVFVDDEIACV